MWCQICTNGYSIQNIYIWCCPGVPITKLNLWNYVQVHILMPQLYIEKPYIITLSKRPSYTACLNTLKGVYQNGASGSALLLSSGL